MAKSIKVEYIRDGLVEEFHTGVLEFGFESMDESPYYLRSCAKPLQAVLLIDYGLDFTQEEIAFCSGSHAGEDCHISVAQSIMAKLGIDETYLKCGIHSPLSRTMQDKMLLNGEKPTALHNNCSGKHLGFLAVCKKNGWDLENYYLPNHPLQIEVKKKIYELCEVKKEYPMTTDGCGVPIVSMPLKNLIVGFKNLNNKYPELVKSIMKNPYIYGGEDRLDTEIMEKTSGIIAKVGAGGLCVVFNTVTNDGFAIKMEDASTSARKFAVMEYINALGWGDLEIDKTIKTLSGKTVGEIVVLL